MSTSDAHRDAMARIEAAAGQAARAKAIAGNGHDDEAMVLLWDALPVLERELGAYHPEVGDALLDLAAIHIRRGEEGEAAMLLARVHAITDEPAMQHA